MPQEKFSQRLNQPYKDTKIKLVCETKSNQFA